MENEPTLPSDNYFVTQALHNVGLRQWGEHYKVVMDVATFGGDFCPPWLFMEVRREIARLEAKFYD